MSLLAFGTAPIKQSAEVLVVMRQGIVVLVDETLELTFILIASKLEKINMCMFHSHGHRLPLENDTVLNPVSFPP
jgi:hypothetical protein